MADRRRSLSLYIDRVENYKPSMTKIEDAFALFGIPFSVTEVLEKSLPTFSNSKISKMESQCEENHDLLHIMEYLNMYLIEQGMARIFQEFDKDGDGFISPEELRRLLINLGEEITESDIMDMIAVADEDGDGRVSLYDFTHLLTSIQSQSIGKKEKTRNRVTTKQQRNPSRSLDTFPPDHQSSCTCNIPEANLSSTQKNTQVLPRSKTFSKKSIRNNWRKVLKSIRK